MCVPAMVSLGLMALTTGVSIFSGLEAAKGQIKSGKANKNYYSYLANLSDKEASAVGKKGMRDLSTVTIAERGVEAGQRAVMAANGIGAGSVTAEDVLMDTFDKAELDKMAIRYNADVAVWNSKNQARSYRMAGDNALQAANIGANTSLITTAAGVADKWLNYGSASGWGIRKG